MAIPGRWRDWLARFGPAELAGIVGSYCGYLGISALGLPPVVAAYGAALGENTGYYGVIAVRDWRAAPPAERRVSRIAANMVHDFGIAEVLDSFVVRPAVTLASVSLLGAALGIGVGKVLSDVVFYVLAIAFYERRRAREGRH